MSVRRLAFLSATLLAAPALAGTRYVDVNATGANNGTSWADAYSGVSGLRIALSVALPGDEIWVADGTYKPSTNGNRNNSFLLKNGVTVYGGFAGGETSLAQRNFVANVTILSGDLAGNDGSIVFSDNTFHIFVAGSTVDSTSIYDGFTVRGGYAASHQTDTGGALFCFSGGSPTLRNCTFVANNSIYLGGAVYVDASSPTFLGCTFDGNKADIPGGFFGTHFGGAVYIDESSNVTFDRCVFKNNTAQHGGALLASGSLSTLNCSNSLFIGNTSTEIGAGAIGSSAAITRIRNCTVVGNFSKGSTSSAISFSGVPTIANCIVLQNTGDIPAQIAPAGLAVTHSLVVPAYAGTGTGNISTPPTFAACGPYPYRLAAGSAGIDAGSNAGAAAGFPFDLGGSPRFVDVYSVANTGVGTGAIVDMGCYEADVDCNSNGIPDACDLLSGTSLDANANGVPDECECQGATPPSTYCTAKRNSLFCIPSIGFSGFPSATNFGPFLITASNVLNQKSGLLFYGYTQQAVPLLGGTLCIGSPLRRTPTQLSGGTATGANCTGTYSFDFNAFIASGVDPLIQNFGQAVSAQWWSRDPQDPFLTGLTNALQFTICQ
ncbi:MAG: right-handed parallel beta-helix repeat-containing protein [Planctomycetota bacterium]|nr:right-handed parallel beta-helix repeat-containing protein [Planctomycetota bacterium]